MNGISVILLAAGESRRMGEHNKQTLQIAGVPLVRRTLQTILSARPEETVVVLGHRRAASEICINDLPARIVWNANYRQGQMTSVHTGMQALTKPCAGVMVCLVDQPLIQRDDLTLLAKAFVEIAATGAPMILVPTYQSQRGNPVVLPYAMRDAILAGGMNLGCRNIIKRNPDKVTTFEMPNNHVIVDLDTPQDYQRITRLLPTPRATNSDNALGIGA